jgi:Ala-tRNA(Pro) deacylase
MAIARLTEFLDTQKVAYLVVSHSPAYTAQGIAALVHIPGNEMAKTVMVKVNDKLAMVVLPAKFHVDLAALKSVAHAETAALASEDDFRDAFPECETGAMPPFGNLFGIPVFADESLEKDTGIAFNAGTHRELIRMTWADFKRLAGPTMGRLATGRTAEAA